MKCSKQPSPEFTPFRVVIDFECRDEVKELRDRLGPSSYFLTGPLYDILDAALRNTQELRTEEESQ